MIRSLLIKRLKENLFVQLLAGFLPVALIATYIILYSIDSLYFQGVLENNNKLTDILIKENRLYEVRDIANLTDTDADILLNDVSGYSLNLGYGDLVYEVYFNDINDYTYILSDSTVLNSSYCGIIEAITKESDLCRIGLSNGTQFSIASGELLAKVSLTDDGDFMVQYGKDMTISEEKEGLYGVDVVQVYDDIDRCLLCFTMTYNVSLSDCSVNFCTNLPSEGLYIDLQSFSLVRNVTQDYIKNLILSSNIVVVLASMLLYYVFLMSIANMFDLKYVKRTSIQILNYVALFMLGYVLYDTLTIL